MQELTLKTKIFQINKILEKKFEDSKFVSENYIYTILISWNDIIKLDEKKGNLFVLRINNVKIVMLRIKRKLVLDKLSITELEIEKEFFENVQFKTINEIIEIVDKINEKNCSKYEKEFEEFVNFIENKNLSLDEFKKIIKKFNKLPFGLKKELENKD